MRVLASVALVAAALGSLPALAGEQTVTLSVPGMFCASCPYIVSQAIGAVDGVRDVEATMEDRTATVIFDDETTTVDAIRQATAAVGYPSEVIEAGGS